MVNREYLISRFRDIFNKTLESELTYCGDIDSIDYYDLFCKAASKEHLYYINGNNLCMFNYDYEGKEAVLIIVSIPINSDTKVKDVAEHVMDVVSILEECFIKLEVLKSEEVKEDKFIYVTAVKTLETKQGGTLEYD